MQSDDRSKEVTPDVMISDMRKKASCVVMSVVWGWSIVCAEILMKNTHRTGSLTFQTKDNNSNNHTQSPLQLYGEIS